MELNNRWTSIKFEINRHGSWGITGIRARKLRTITFINNLS